MHTLLLINMGYMSKEIKMMQIIDDLKKYDK
jgi:hypothetical protein